MNPKTTVQVWMPCLLAGYGGVNFAGDPLTAFCSFAAALFLVWLAWRWDRWAWATVPVERAESRDWLALEMEQPRPRMSVQPDGSRVWVYDRRIPRDPTNRERM